MGRNRHSPTQGIDAPVAVDDRLGVLGGSRQAAHPRDDAGELIVALAVQGDAVAAAPARDDAHADRTEDRLEALAQRLQRSELIGRGRRRRGDRRGVAGVDVALELADRPAAVGAEDRELTAGVVLLQAQEDAPVSRRQASLLDEPPGRGRAAAAAA